jgi:Tol biopolymer transport system component
MREPLTQGDRLLSTPAVLEIPTGTVRDVAEPSAIYDAPRWDPSGELLALATNDQGIVVIPSDGVSPARTIASGDAIYYLAAVWSKDGRLLAFERDRSGPTTLDSDSYVVVKPDLGITDRVSEGNPDECGRELWLRDHEAHWVPGTSLAAWTTGCHTGQPRAVGIWLKDMLGSDERLLDVTGVVEQVGLFDVSPNGKTIAFTESGTSLGIYSDPTINPAVIERMKLYAVGIDGGRAELLASGAKHPAWRPGQ